MPNINLVFNKRTQIIDAHPQLASGDKQLRTQTKTEISQCLANLHTNSPDASIGLLDKFLIQARDENDFYHRKIATLVAIKACQQAVNNNGSICYFNSSQLLENEVPGLEYFSLHDRN